MDSYLSFLPSIAYQTRFRNSPLLSSRNCARTPKPARNFRTSGSFNQPLSKKAAINKAMTHSNPKALVFLCKNTSIETSWERSEKEFEEPVIELSAEFNFHTNFVALKIFQTCSGQFKVEAFECYSGKSRVPHVNTGDGFTLVLSGRHALETDFSLSLKYSLITKRGAANFDSDYTFQVPFFQTETALTFEQLCQFHPTEEITRIFHKQTEALSCYPSDSGLTHSSFETYKMSSLFSKLEKAVTFEDLAAREAIKHLSLDDVIIRGSQTNYFVETKNIKAIRAERWREMTLFLIPMAKYREPYNNPKNCTYVQIKDIHKNSISIDTKKKLFKGYSYHIDFIPNRIGVRACINALEAMEDNNLVDFFLNVGDNSSHEASSLNDDKLSIKITALKQATFESFEWFNKSIASNYEQRLAIKNIVNCCGYPYPQIVFGPPGTGKTSLLVECVAQIIKLRPDCRILIATQSNSASDEIGVRLLKFVSANHIYRFYSPSMLSSTNGGPNPELKPFSNLRNNKVKWPTKEELRHFNVVISTLITSSRLAQSNIGNEHFDYIFVDEISCATEPEALVPIIGLGTMAKKITSNIVMLGDHLQLGPVLESEEFSQKLGLGVSFMERLMSSPRYSKSPFHNEKYVVQLLDNYRSHPAILKFSSDQFYDGTLRPKMTASDQALTESWSFLPNKTFPIIFHAVETRSQLDGTSSYNIGEVDIVMSYVRTLLATKWGDKSLEELDIGVISPYLAQLKKLKKALNSLWPEIEMGTAEYFQGREKRVIIISTVKSKSGIGFLSNEKRCNVMLTRAKSFEVVVGNPETLRKDPIWKAFVEYCEVNRSLIYSSSIDLLNLNFGEMKM